MGLSMGLIWRNDSAYVLDKTGYFLLHDDMAAINLHFIQDVCYQGLFKLDNALLEEKPLDSTYLVIGRRFIPH